MFNAARKGPPNFLDTVVDNFSSLTPSPTSFCERSLKAGGNVIVQPG